MLVVGLKGGMDVERLSKFARAESDRFQISHGFGYFTGVESRHA
jgi:hypothetical protein